MIHNKVRILTIVLISLLMYFPAKTVIHAATWSGVSPIPLDSNFDLVSSSYDYNPRTQ